MGRFVPNCRANRKHARGKVRRAAAQFQYFDVDVLPVTMATDAEAPMRFAPA